MYALRKISNNYTASDRCDFVIVGHPEYNSGQFGDYELPNPGCIHRKSRQKYNAGVKLRKPHGSLKDIELHAGAADTYQCKPEGQRGRTEFSKETGVPGTFTVPPPKASSVRVLQASACLSRLTQIPVPREDRPVRAEPRGQRRKRAPLATRAASLSQLEGGDELEQSPSRRPILSERDHAAAFIEQLQDSVRRGPLENTFCKWVPSGGPTHGGMCNHLSSSGVARHNRMVCDDLTALATNSRMQPEKTMDQLVKSGSWKHWQEKFNNLQRVQHPKLSRSWSVPYGPRGDNPIE